jgi:hypothetical protein
MATTVSTVATRTMETSTATRTRGRARIRTGEPARL